LPLWVVPQVDEGDINDVHSFGLWHRKIFLLLFLLML
jgi:hypothetical protein